ncbi:MAG: glutamine--tRNA ligase/YqeY domain fusion protein [Phycisphaera sp.]|nr:glutamine--tRNA ligase/YqeY domain fusion protein [Phycisphaera sp.]
MSTESTHKMDFIREIVAEDIASGKHATIVTRFPPEPNGFLHIGHAKALCISFGVAQDVNAGRLGEGKATARTHLRMDDTNPVKEEKRYIDAIHADVKWLGFDWGEHEYYASDYFEQLVAWAELLIGAGKAYVDDQTGDEIRATRGTLTEPGKASPFRDRTPEENLDLFARMKAGEFADGSRVLRAKIDMAAPNMNLRDPVMYRVLHAVHPHAGDKWCVYPMYDYAHGQSDWIEGITHSLCSLEFEAHRPLYDWFVDAIMDAGGHPRLPAPGAPVTDELRKDRPRQIEFARLNLTYTVMSKRRLLALVNDKHVAGWDDPRMPTLSAMRRRGYPAEAIREFADGIGLSKRNQTIDLARLEFHVREHLNKSAERRMAVLDPLKVVITNYPDDTVEHMDAINNPEDEGAGTRKVPFSKVLYIEREDFMEDPPKKFFRLGPGREVRLRYAYFVTCTDVIKDAAGNIVELHCTYDPATKGGDAPDGRKVKGTLHWVSAAHALDAEVRLYDTLFTQENPDDVEEGKSWTDQINPDSLKTITAKVEPAMKTAKAGTTVQFERTGYFCVDPDTEDGPLIVNRTVTLKDSWGKQQGK